MPKGSFEVGDEVLIRGVVTAAWPDGQVTIQMPAPATKVTLQGDTGHFPGSGRRLGREALTQARAARLGTRLKLTVTQKQNFCKLYKSNSASLSSIDKYSERIVNRAYDSYDECVRVAEEGVKISHKFSGYGIVQIFLKAAIERPVRIDGITVSGSVQCFASADEKNKGSITQKDVPGTFNITCRRDENRTVGAANRYDAADVLMSTNVGPYSFTMPDIPSDETVQQAERAAAMKVASALDAYRAKLESLIPSQVVYFSAGVDVGSGGTGVQSVSCPAGWTAVSGGIGPQPGYTPFAADRVHVTAVSGGYTIDAWNRAGDQRGNQLLLAQITCERPKFSAIPAP